MDTNELFSWPPEVVIKKHPRAKHVKLRATKTKGLELVVPKRFNLKEVPFILEQNRQWIEKQLRKLYSTTQTKPIELPQLMDFLCIQQQWVVTYQQNPMPLKIIARPHQELVLLGNIADKQHSKTILMSWVKKHARSHLLNLLADVSGEIGLPYTRASIRNQSSRWGSCSADKVVNLNFKLIFLPLKLTRHIMIHELCHTEQLNHSEKFWQLVTKFDPHCEIHRREMRHAEDYIPGWIEGNLASP